MKQYHDLCKHVLKMARKKGKLNRRGAVPRKDRTGTGTIGVFGYQMRYDLTKGFPMMTTKKISLRLIVSELIWFIAGDTNIRFLLQQKNPIWNEWAFKKWAESDEYDGVDMTDFGIRAGKDSEFKKLYDIEMKRFVQRILEDDAFAENYGSLGSVYGEQWRSWKGVDGKAYDQLQWIIDEIKRNPNSRRLILSAWNVPVVMSGTMALPPCHTIFQFYVEDGKLSCQLYQRSGDIFLGIPFNIASYALLTHMVAQVTGLEVGEFIHTIGDAHIYVNHLDQIKTQLKRETFALPTLKLNPDVKTIEDFKVEDVELIGYEAHPHIKGEVAV